MSVFEHFINCCYNLDLTLLGIPLNLALVGHTFVSGTSTYPLRDDETLSAYLKLVAPSSYIQMASHSHQYLPYTGKTVAEIEVDLNSSKRENEFVTGEIVT